MTQNQRNNWRPSLWSPMGVIVGLTVAAWSIIGAACFLVVKWIGM